MAYTTSSLIAYMIVTLGATFEALGSSVLYPMLAEGEAEIAALLGHTTAEETDQLKLRVLGRWQAWRAALGSAVGQYDLASGQTNLKRSQGFEHIEKMLRDAEAAASVYVEVANAIGSGGIAYVGSMSTVGSPYEWQAD